MRGYDDRFVVVPDYVLGISVDYSGRSRRYHKTFPAGAGTADLSDCGDFSSRFGSAIIGEPAGDHASLPVLFDGGEITVPLDRTVRVKRIYEETDPRRIPSPVRISERNARLFGDYAKKPDPPLETVTITFAMYRVFEDIYQEALYYLTQAEAGDTKSQFIIAEMLREGTGIRQSRKEAREWLAGAIQSSGLSGAEAYWNGSYWWVRGRNG